MRLDNLSDTPSLPKRRRLFLVPGQSTTVRFDSAPDTHQEIRRSIASGSHVTTDSSHVLVPDCELDVLYLLQTRLFSRLPAGRQGRRTTLEVPRRLIITVAKRRNYPCHADHNPTAHPEQIDGPGSSSDFPQAAKLEEPRWRCRAD
jgi:hypothetical protein